MKHNSSLFAGLKLDHRERRAEELSEKEIRIVNERDLVTPDLSRVHRLQDLERIGIRDLRDVEVKMARMQNGKLRLVLNAHSLGRKVTNRDVTESLNELAIRFRNQKGRWTPPNSCWRDVQDAASENSPRRLITDQNNIGNNNNNINNINNQNGCRCHRANRFDDPVQGATSNSWLIAAIFSVFWADPSIINRCTRATNNRADARDERKRALSVRFHDKGGRNNNRTATIDVNYEVPVNNSSNEPVYCRSSDGDEIWPSLYEKAYAKWITGCSSDRPDITQTSNGDPIKAMAQINGREPHYYSTHKHSAGELVGLVRSSSMNFKTIHPMAAWTHASGHVYRGSNLVANHAYSVLGWASHGDKQYVILRNPWGVTEPTGLTSYPGLLERVEREFWHPASLLDNGGVLALEASAFKEYFAYVGLAK